MALGVLQSIPEEAIMSRHQFPRNSKIYRRHWLVGYLGCILILAAGALVGAFLFGLHPWAGWVALVVAAIGLMLWLLECWTHSVQFVGYDICLTAGCWDSRTDTPPLWRCNFWKHQSLFGRIFQYGDLHIHWSGRIVCIRSLAQIDEIVHQAQLRRQTAYQDMVQRSVER
jgi:hypothetical protein